MEITNWSSFNRLWPTIFLMILSTIQTFYIMKKRKIKNPKRIIIWTLICSCGVIDCAIHILLSTVDRIAKYPFPIMFQLLIDLSLVFKILLVIFLLMLYVVYFQWNIICEYNISGKDMSERQQQRCQKGSAYVMYIVLIFHFLFYAMFFRTILFF